LVGGAIRDLFFKKPFIKDFDFLVKGETKTLVSEIAKELAIPYFPLDESWGIWRLIFKEGKRKWTMDFSSMHADQIELDLQQRDFTINSMALDLSSLAKGQPISIIDPLNGLHDLEQRILRVNAEDSFRKDPLRMLRAFRLAANLNLRIEENTLCLIKKNKKLLPQSAAERIRAEFFALLNEQQAASFLRSLFQVGILEVLFPEIQSWADFPQGPHHDFYLLEHAFQTVAAVEFILAHLADIFPARAKALQDNFAELVEEGVTRQALLKFGAFFHDSGKPVTYSFTPVEKIPRFLDHDQKGKTINEQICQRLKLSRQAIKLVTDMTGQHMRILGLAQLSQVTPRAKYRFFRDLGKGGIEIAILSLADKMAARRIKFQWPQPADTPDDLSRVTKLVLELIHYYYVDFQPQKKKLFLDGQEIMATFGLPPGKKVGELLTRLREAEDAGLIQSKEEAWQFLKIEQSREFNEQARK
ncbi:MAG: HD domain-containing protein, partial [bacterium]